MIHDGRPPGTPSDASDPPAALPALDEPRLIRRLDGGAIGEVYLAEHILLQRHVRLPETDQGVTQTRRRADPRGAMVKA